MKKILFLSALLAGGMAMVSCSSDDAIAPGSEARFNENGIGYLSVGIDLPSGQGTRANGDFGNATENESQVKDVIIALFGGAAAEADAELKQVFKYTDGAWSTGSGEVEKFRLFTQSVTASNFGNNPVYAIAIVNGVSTGAFEVSENTLTAKAASDVSISKLSAVYDAILENKIGDDTNGYLMLTAPYSVLPGKTADPSGTDHAVKKWNAITNGIKPTEAEAIAAATNIYVERAAAKVELKVSLPTTDGDKTTVGNLTFDKDNVKWMIDNYNTKFYALRHFNADGGTLTNKNGLGWLPVVNNNNYRFVEEKDYEGNASGDNSINMFRTTWGEDVNYSDLSTNQLTHRAGERPGTSDTAMKNAGTAVYVAENTMDDANMKWNHTTRVIVALTFNNGSDFYTHPNHPNQLITDATSYTNAWIGVTENKTTLNNTVNDWIDNNIVSTSTETWKGYTKEYTATGTSVSVTFKESDTEKPLTVDDIQAADGETIDDAALEARKTALTNSLTLKVSEGLATSEGMKFYQGGVAYYPIRIQHFGTSETPWTEVQSTDYNTVYGTGDDRINNYLGRYGVLRNNWYELTVTSVKALGEPTVPKLDGTPDDTAESYLSVNINILKWGKRTQNNIELK